MSVRGDLVAALGGEPIIGQWDHPLAAPNLEDAHIVHALAGAADLPGLSRLEAMYRKRFRLKTWQYMTAVSDDLFIAFVVGTAGFASNGFVYAAELPSGAVHEKFAITPLTVGTHLAPTSARGTHRFATSGLAVTIDNLDGGRCFAASIRGRTKAGVRLDAELAFASGDNDQHLAVCVPLPGGRWSYTHKYAGFQVTGRVLLDGRVIQFAPGRAFGAMDFTKMYALRHAVWRWIALAGKTRAGKTIGLNLVDPTPAAPISENALWIDGKRDAIANVVLEADPAGPWRVSADTIDLEMRSVAQVEQKLDVPLVKHHLKHIVGAFSGHVRTQSGHIHDLDSIVGIAEAFDNWW